MYPIAVVARRAGLTVDALRAWERRFDTIVPDRDEAGRRIYSPELCARVEMLGTIVRGGYRIGDVVNLPESELVKLLAEVMSSADASGRLRPPNDPPARVRGGAGRSADVRARVDEAVDAALALNPAALRAAIESSLTEVGRHGLSEVFVFPFMRAIKRARDRGDGGEVHVSFARGVVRSVLASFLVAAATVTGDVRRPTAAVAGPVGYVSDIALLTTAIHVSSAGWRPLVLGANLPAEEIARGVRQSGAACLIVGAVSETYCVEMMGEMARLRDLLADDLPLYFGGRLPGAMVDDLINAGLEPLTDMEELEGELVRLDTKVHVATGAR